MEIATAAAIALGKIGGDQAAGALTKALQADKAKKKKKAQAKSIGRMSPGDAPKRLI